MEYIHETLQVHASHSDDVSWIMKTTFAFFVFELSSLDLVPYSKLCPGLNNNFMVYLLQLHINPFSEWHLAGASVSYGHFFYFFFSSSPEPKAHGELLWSLAVRRRRCRRRHRPDVRPSTVFKQHLLLNHWWEFDQTSQEWSLVGPLSKLFKWFRFIAYLGHRS